MFSKTWCPYCAKTKKFFEAVGANYTVIETDEVRHGFFIGMAVEELTNQQTVPNIFISGIHMGGSDVIEGMYKTGQLQKIADNLKKV